MRLEVLLRNPPHYLGSSSQRYICSRRLRGLRSAATSTLNVKGDLQEFKEMDSISALFRASQVYATALRVAWHIKSTQRQEKRLRISHGLSMEDDDSHPSIDELWEETHETNAEIICGSIISLKGLWIKVGQFLSSRPDIMPMAYVRHFRKLQDALPSRPWSEVEGTLQSCLGTNYQAVYFRSVVEEPISCASIAQVHRATLKSGEDVVIKVRHHNVENLMKNDLKNLDTLCYWIARWEPKYDFRKIVAEWIPAVQEELDLTNEAQSLKEVKANMEKDNVKVIVPRIPNEDLIKPSVLVMEYCKGFSVRETTLYKEHGVDKVTLLERVCKAWAVQLHVNGVFNADPHPGNILISTDENMNGGDPSVPILLDFGLTRRFNDTIRVAFSRLVHSCYVMDIDEMLKSFEEMGLMIPEKDPFQDIYNLRMVFQTTPASVAKEEREQRIKSYKMKQKASPRTRQPLDAWPGELVFFTRVIGLLKGLCSTLEVRYPYLQKTAEVASKTLTATYRNEDHAKGLVYPETKASGSLQERIKSTLLKKKAEGELLGCQVAAMHKGKYVVDIAAGTLSTTDPRPVKPDTLFNVFSVTKGLAALLVHMAIQKEESASYDDLVSTYWKGFGINGKESCTIRHVLNHQAGLANAFPENATVERLLDWNENLSFLKSAEPAYVPGDKEHYHYLTFGYLTGGILEGMTGKSFKELVDEWIVQPLDIPGELYVGLPMDISADRLAVLHNGFLDSQEDGLLQSFGAEQTVSSVAPTWERYKGLQHMYNPTTFNMRQVREACMPSANGHMSGRAIAMFYSLFSQSAESTVVNFDSIIQSLDGKAVERNSTNDVFLASSSDVIFGLGFRVYKFLRESDNSIVYGFGHPGLGGSFGMAIPDEDFSIGITTSYLKQDRKLVFEIINEACALLNIKPVNDFKTN